MSGQNIPYRVIPYDSSKKEEWNTFIQKAKNATFLFQRDFMEYHSDRFKDFSLMVYQKENLLAVLPANRVENNVFSHQGLSYGGLVLKKDIGFEEVTESFKAVLQFLEEEGVELLHLKLLPKIYHLLPADEMDYLLFKLKAKLTRRDISSVIAFDNRLEIKSSNRKRGVKRAERAGLEIREENDLSSFWNEILTPNLQASFNINPVHSASEIQNLKDVFPEEILQFNVYQKDKILAGTTLFVTANVVHVQYISSDEKGRNSGALDYLYSYLLDYFSSKKYFSFGISNEAQGENVNRGLLNWKESFGARTVIHSFYKISTKNHHLLNDFYL